MLESNKPKDYDEAVEIIKILYDTIALKDQTLALRADRVAQFAAQVKFLIKFVEDMELLMRINCPLPDGSPMHKEAKRILNILKGEV